jgi:hypothetical protein
MKSENNKKMTGLIASGLFLVGTIIAFVMLWTGLKTDSTSDVATTAGVSTASASSVDALKKEADVLLKGKSNLSGMPIQSPEDTKIGKPNPFK